MTRPLRYANVGLGFVLGALAWSAVWLAVPREGPDGLVLLLLLFGIGLWLSLRRPSAFFEATVGTSLAAWFAAMLFMGLPLNATPVAILGGVFLSLATLCGELVGVVTWWFCKRRRERCATRQAS